MMDPVKKKPEEEVVNQYGELPNPYGADNDPSLLNTSSGRVNTTTYQPTPAEQEAMDIVGTIGQEDTSQALAGVDPATAPGPMDVTAPVGGYAPPTRITTSYENTLAPRTPEQAAELTQNQYREQSGVAHQEAAGDLGLQAIERYEQERANVQKQAVQQQWAQEAQFEQQRKDTELAVFDAEDRYRTLQKELTETQNNQGPQAYWKNKNGFERVLAAIASGMGAFAAIHNRTRNFAQDIIDNAVQQEIDAQREALQTGKESVAQAGSLYGQALKTFGDVPQAEAAARAELHESVAKQLERMQGTLKTDLENAKWQEMYGANKEKAAQAKQQVIDAQLGKQKIETVQRFGGAPRQMSEMDKAKLRKIQLENAKSEKELVHGKDGSVEIAGIGKIKNKEAAKELADAYAGFMDAGAGLDQMRQMREQMGPKLASAAPFGVGGALSEDVQRADTLQKFTVNAFGKSVEGSRMSDEDRQFYLGQARSPAAIGNVQAGWDSMDLFLRNRLLATARQAGVDPRKVLSEAKKRRGEIAKQAMGESTIEGARKVE